MERKNLSYMLRLMRVFVLSAVLLPGMFGVLAAESDIARIRTKAERFYRYDEWANALAMFRILLENAPADMCTYGRSVAVYGIIGGKEEQMALVERTQDLGLSLDRLFEEVRKSAFEKGHPQVLEEFMFLVRERQPWMRRNIDLRLARYYDSRNDAPKMIEQSDSLLLVNPNDREMLRIKARGYFLMDRFPESMEVYKRLVALDSGDLDALLTLGVYYAEQVRSCGLSKSSAEAEEARRYLERAYGLRPTAYVAEMLSALK